MNCNNGPGIYSFHPDGANVGGCDGSVRFVKETIPVALIFALATRELRLTITEGRTGAMA